MTSHDFPLGVMPSVVSANGLTYVAFGVVGLGVEVHAFPSGHADRAGRVFADHRGMRGDPALSPDGRLVGYFLPDDTGIVMEMQTGQVIASLPKLQGNHAIRLRNDAVVYQTHIGVTERRLSDGAERWLGPYLATGIAYLTETGYVSWDANRFVQPGMLSPAFAGSTFIIGEDATSGLRVWLDGRPAHVWAGQWNDCTACPESVGYCFAAWSPGKALRVVAGLHSLSELVTSDPVPVPIPPVPIPEPVPMPEIPDQTSVVASVRASYGTPLGAQHADCLLAIARAIGQGAGLLRKPDGFNVTLPDGVKVSQDIIAFPDGRIYDCLGDAEGAATPGWMDKGTVDPSRYYRVTEQPEPEPTPEPEPGVSTHDLVLALGRHLGAWH